MTWLLTTVREYVRMSLLFISRLVLLISKGYKKAGHILAHPVQVDGAVVQGVGCRTVDQADSLGTATHSDQWCQRVWVKAGK